jgi:pre-mRNA-splicing factor RBM22/SLT11
LSIQVNFIRYPFYFILILSMNRHEMPSEEMKNQSIKARYHGTSDPVARKILSGHATTHGMQPPEDESIVSRPYVDLCLGGTSNINIIQTSLFLTLLPPSTTEASLRTVVVQALPQINPENIRSIVHVAKSRYALSITSYHDTYSLFLSRCAFVNFKDRVSAERAAELWALGLEVDGTRAGVKWGRSKAAKAGSSSSAPAATPVTA